MSTHNRLFLFAGFNKSCIIDDALIYYVKSLSKYGDVILCMDCDCKKSELEKIKKYTIHTITGRHGEYDFGSYKRCFQYAQDKNILKNYDVLYLVNDSVFGPILNINKTLNNIESINTDAASLVVSKHRTHSFMESWFIRLNKKIFMSNWFNNFMYGIKQEQNKADITIKYEHGLSNLITSNKCSWSGLFIGHGRFTYNKPKYLFRHGCPFIKKLSFSRHNGSLGRQIKYILNNCDKQATNAIMKTANSLYGSAYMNWFLTSNPLKIFMRTTRYILTKIKNG